MKTLQEKKIIEQYSSLSKKKKKNESKINPAIYKALGPKKIYPKNEGLVMH